MGIAPAAGASLRAGASGKFLGGCSATATKFYSRDEILLVQAVDLNILKTVFLVKSSK